MKSISRVASLEGLVRHTVVPNFRELGPRLGAVMPKVKKALASADGGIVQRALDEQGHYDLDVDGEVIRLGPGDVEIRAEEHEEFALAQEGPLAVALDLAVDEDLRLEGLAREVIRALNDHRKAIGLEIADRVRVALGADGELRQALERHGEWIAGEILAVEWRVDADAGAELDIDGAPLRVAVEKL